MDKGRSKILIIFGLVIGLLSFLFLVTDTAISYSDNGKFCLNCHSMDEAYETLQHSNHKPLKCTECHAPHSYIPKVIFKAKAGLWDLYVTTMGRTPQLIKATDETKEIIAVNCKRCHEATVENIDMGQGRLCTDCHRDLVHRKDLSGKIYKEGI